MRNTLVALVFMAVIGAIALADQPAPAPASPPAAKPGAGAVREEMAPVVAVRTMLRRLAESKDKAVYDEFLADSYRKTHSLDDFGTEAAAVRKSQRLADAIPSVEGWVLLKPEPGEPRAASLTAGWREAVLNAEAGDKDVLCLRLVESDGRWRVTELRQLRFGKELYGYHAAIKGARTDKDAKRHVTSHLNGTVVKLDQDSLVLKPAASSEQPWSDVFEKEGKWDAEPDRNERTIKLDKRTIVWKTTITPNRGQWFEKGTKDDLSAGFPLSVNAADDSNHADCLEVITHGADDPLFR